MDVSLPDNFGKGGWKICFVIEPPASCNDGRLKIKFHSDNNRLPHPDKVVEETIKDMWKKRKDSMGNMWNALKFRLDKYTVRDISGKTVVTLDLGVTEYASYQGSSALASPLTFLMSPEKGSPEKHLSRSLGNAAIVVTTDKYIVLLERSSKVGEGAGRWVLPGGHPEPSRVSIPETYLSESFKGSNDTCVAIERELYMSISLEVEEEIGLYSSEMSPIQLIGMVQRERDLRPVLLGHTKITLTRGEIEARFCCEDIDNEASRILFFHLDNVQNFYLQHEILMPEHRGALQLYTQSSLFVLDQQS
eukprot:jgi/Galph1/1814/GphlegSOOS_G493.1